MTTAPRVLVVEVAPIIMLIGLCFVLTVEGGTLMRYTDAAARSLHAPAGYIHSVLPATVTQDNGGGATP